MTCWRSFWWLWSNHNYCWLVWCWPSPAGEQWIARGPSIQIGLYKIIPSHLILQEKPHSARLSIFICSSSFLVFSCLVRLFLVLTWRGTMAETCQKNNFYYYEDKACRLWENVLSNEESSFLSILFSGQRSEYPAQWGCGKKNCNRHHKALKKKKKNGIKIMAWNIAEICQCQQNCCPPYQKGHLRPAFLSSVLRLPQVVHVFAPS